MIINKAFKYRLKPTAEQLALLKQHGGNTRWLWNHLLADNMEYYKQTGKFKFEYEMNNSLPVLKKDADTEFLKLSYSQSLQQVSKHLSEAMKSCFAKAKGFPKFKKKNNFEDAFAIPQNIVPKKHYVEIPKIGKVSWIRHRRWEGRYVSATVIQDGDNWYCSLLCEVDIPDIQPIAENIIGIDVGLKEFATFSDGTQIGNKRLFKKEEKKLSKAQRQLSRKEKGSSNFKKQVKKIRSIYKNISNKRSDYIHKITTDMITKYSGFAVEHLNIRGMMQNPKLAKSIADVAWGEFFRVLEYKSLWSGKYFITIDRFAPTSKTCSCCGFVNENLTLKDRIFVCSRCGLTMDRDLNAAINIRDIGLDTLGQRGIYAGGDWRSKADQEAGKRMPSKPLELVANG